MAIATEFVAPFERVEPTPRLEPVTSEQSHVEFDRLAQADVRHSPPPARVQHVTTVDLVENVHT